jgi:hypothetical protein
MQTVTLVQFTTYNCDASTICDAGTTFNSDAVLTWVPWYSTTGMRGAKFLNSLTQFVIVDKGATTRKGPEPENWTGDVSKRF